MRIIVVALRGESLRHVEVQFSKIKEAWSIARGGASGLRGLQRASTARRSGSRQWRIAWVVHGEAPRDVSETGGRIRHSDAIIR
jgi:hypothetical protein